MSALDNIIKRSIDFIISTIGLVVFSPFLLICYVLIKLEDGGAAIYSQERIGRGGRPFRIYKFRTMIADGERDGIPQLAEENDKRLTRIGRFLRAHHLDELPQLWNVCKGDMSFVGYRPERKYFIDQIMQLRPDYERLYAIRPGITSYATLYNGYTNTMEKMIRRLDMDLEYLERMSTLEDLKIVVKTALSVFSGKHF